jgi:hypothetical protein
VADIATFGLLDLLIGGLGPASVASQLMARAINLTYGDRHNVLVVPGIVPSSGNAGFVLQGAPIPVRAYTTDVVAIELKKFATIIPLTREVITSSAAEAMTRAVVTESLALALDSAMLDTTVASALRPAGLRAQVNAITAASTGVDAMKTDLAVLADAVTSVGGLDLVYIADPKSAVKLLFGVGPQFQFPILSSGGLSAGTLICIAVPALCVTIDPQPEISASAQATVQMDTAPQAGGLVDSGGSVGASIRSFYQTDVIGIRFITNISWCLRASNAISWVTGVNW